MFNALDRTGKGFLTAADMWPFAEQTGFTGTDREWQLEFEALCHESRSSQGLGLDAFAKLVNDDSEDGCYCTDSELQALLQRLHQGSIESNTSVPNAATSGKGSQPQPASEVRMCITALKVLRSVQVMCSWHCASHDPRVHGGLASEGVGTASPDLSARSCYVKVVVEQKKSRESTACRTEVRDKDC